MLRLGLLWSVWGPRALRSHCAASARSIGKLPFAHKGTLPRFPFFGEEGRKERHKLDCIPIYRPAAAFLFFYYLFWGCITHTL